MLICRKNPSKPIPVGNNGIPGERMGTIDTNQTTFLMK
jgi:hypothetical protein